MWSSQKMKLNFTQCFQKQENATYNLYSLHFFLSFFFCLLPTFFLEEDEQDSRKLEEVVKDKRVEMQRTRGKMKMTKLVFEKQKIGKRTSRIKSFQGRQIKYISVTLKNNQQVLSIFRISVCRAT